MTQKEIISQIKEAEEQLAKLRYCSDPEFIELKNKVREYENKWYEKTKEKREEIVAHIQMLRGDLKAVKEARNPVLPEHVKNWLREYHRGVDWGYGGLTVRWISEDERWAILTNGGGTAGTGTAMGTHGYYYAECSHFLGCIEHPGGLENRYEEIHGGRLTQERKAQLIASIPYIEQGEKFRAQKARNEAKK